MVGDTLPVAQADGDAVEAVLSLGSALDVAFPSVLDAEEEGVEPVAREGEALPVPLPPPPTWGVALGGGVRVGGGDEVRVELPSVEVRVGGGDTVGGPGVTVGTPPEAVGEEE